MLPAPNPNASQCKLDAFVRRHTVGIGINYGGSVLDGFSSFVVGQSSIQSSITSTFHRPVASMTPLLY